jgi:hypothetical protein
MQGEFAMYFYDMQQQGPLPNWQQWGQIGPQFAQLNGPWLGNPGLPAYGQQAYGQQNGQYGTQQPFGAFGHNSGWGAQPQGNMQPAGGQWGGQQQHRQLSPYDVNEVVRQLVPALPQIIAQAQQPHQGLANAAYGQAPRTLTPQDVNDVVRQLLPLLPQIVGALQGQPQQQFAMHGGIGGMGQGHLGQHFAAQNPFAMQNPLAASFQQPSLQQPSLQQPWQFGSPGQQYGVPQFQSAFGGPQQWGQSQRQLMPQDMADVSRQLAALIPQVIGNLQANNQQRMM